MTFAELFQKIISFYYSSPVRSNLATIKIIAYFLIFLFSLFIIYFAVIKTGYFQDYYWQDLIEIMFGESYNLKKLRKKWKKNLRKLKSKSQSEWKAALSEAEIILVKIFQETKTGAAGQNLEEKLKLIDKSQLPNIEEVLQAHQLYSEITSNPNYQLTIKETQKIIQVYEQTISFLIDSKR